MYRCIGKLQFELQANSKSYFDKNERTNCILHYDDTNKIITDLRGEMFETTLKQMRAFTINVKHHKQLVVFI